MFIQSYQINNILSVYRKQLSQPAVHSRMIENQRQSIIDQVSIDIAARMAGGESEKAFELALDCAHNATSIIEQPPNASQRLRFTYTLIDENNHKRTNSLPVDEFYPVVGENSAHETLAPRAGLMILRGTQPRFTQTWEGGPHD